MNVQHHSCDPQQIGRLLSDDLSGDEQGALECHLEDCLACRETLETMAAKLSWWHEARDFLSSAAGDDGSSVVTGRGSVAPALVAGRGRDAERGRRGDAENETSAPGTRPWLSDVHDDA
ncbi:MAG TPA: hypothetical protein VJ783_11650, partial [Pirellulales bacterium]|nr:hypothetical protein [Pirellulales bacterium]